MKESRFNRYMTVICPLYDRERVSLQGSERAGARASRARRERIARANDTSPRRRRRVASAAAPRPPSAVARRSTARHPRGPPRRPSSRSLSLPSSSPPSSARDGRTDGWDDAMMMNDARARFLSLVVRLA